jgi:hypothetical protein
VLLLERLEVAVRLHVADLEVRADLLQRLGRRGEERLLQPLGLVGDRDQRDHADHPPAYIVPDRCAAEALRDLGRPAHEDPTLDVIRLAGDLTFSGDAFDGARVGEAERPDDVGVGAARAPEPGRANAVRDLVDPKDRHVLGVGRSPPFSHHLRVRLGTLGAVLARGLEDNLYGLAFGFASLLFVGVLDHVSAGRNESRLGDDESCPCHRLVVGSQDQDDRAGDAIVSGLHTRKRAPKSGWPTHGAGRFEGIVAPGQILLACGRRSGTTPVVA